MNSKPTITGTTTAEVHTRTTTSGETPSLLPDILHQIDFAPHAIMPSGHLPTPGRIPVVDPDAITPATPIAVRDLPETSAPLATAQRSLADYRIAHSIGLPDADAQGFRTFKGRQYVDVPGGAIVQVGRDPQTGLYRARLATELTPSGPVLLLDPGSRLWLPLGDFETMTFPLTANRLEAFRTDLDFTGMEPDSDGLHEYDAKLYAVIENHAYQVLHDQDASTPLIPVMRIVRAADPVARDENNQYVATRPGRSEPVFFDARNGWRGLITGGAGGMQREQGSVNLSERLRALYALMSNPRDRVRTLFPSFDHEQVTAYIQSLGDDVPGALALREAEYASLKQTLKSWSRQILSSSTDSLQTSPKDVSTQILRSWRRETGTTLKLSQISALPPLRGDFSHIRKLEIRSINWSDTADAFLANFRDLQSLTIIGSRLDTLPSPIGDMHDLTTLELRYNRLKLDEHTAARISALVKLERLDLKGNDLGVPPDLGNMPGLKVLDLSSTRIEQWPSGLQTQTGLQLVDLRLNQLREVPPAHLTPPAGQLETIARINGVTLLDGNPFPAGYWQHFERYWESLYMTHPDLVTSARHGAFDIPGPSVERLLRIHPNKTSHQARQFLRELGQDAEARLSHLEQEFATLTEQLRAWSFSGGGARQRYVRANQMQIAADSVGDRYEAQERIFACWRQDTPQMFAFDGTPIGLELNLSGLTLPSLPDLDVDFSHVGSLKLRGMNLRTSPEGFLSRFRHVRWLDLSNNQLRDLPPAIGQMQGMTRLFLSQNQIVLTPETARILSERVTLRALMLESNPLGITPDFSQIADMRSLNLSNTGIDTWPVGLLEQPLLDTVALGYNRITTIPDSVIAPPDAHLSQMARINSTTDVRGNPLTEATLEQVQRFGQRLIDQGITEPGSVNRLVLSAQIRPSVSAQRRFVDVTFERWTKDLLQPEVSTRQAQWQALVEQQGAGPLFDILNRLETGGAGHADLQRRVWGVLDSISENSPESEKLRRELFDRAGEPACCDRAAFSFSNLEVQTMVYNAHKQAGNPDQGRSLADLSRSLFRLHEVDRLAAEDIQRSEAIVRDTKSTLEQKRPHIMRLREEVEIRLAYRFGLKDRLQLPGQPEKVRFIGLGGVTQNMLDDAYKKVRAMDSSPAERQALLSREFWQDYLTNKYRQQFEVQRQPYQDRLAELHESLVAKQLTEPQYKSRSDDLLAQLAIEEAELMQNLTRLELEQPPAGATAAP